MINRQQRRYKVQKAQLGPLGAREEEVLYGMLLLT